MLNLESWPSFNISITIRERKTHGARIIPRAIDEGELDTKPEKLTRLLARIEGEGGWVKAVRLLHE